MEINGNQWKSLEIMHWHQFKTSEISGNRSGDQWKSIEINGDQWNSIEIHRNQWKPMENNRIGMKSIN